MWLAYYRGDASYKAQSDYDEEMLATKHRAITMSFKQSD